MIVVPKIKSGNGGYITGYLFGDNASSESNPTTRENFLVRRLREGISSRDISFDWKAMAYYILTPIFIVGFQGFFEFIWKL